MHARKRIYIAYTGGTIGMQASDLGFVPVAGFLRDTLEHMPEFHRPEMPEFELHEYSKLLDSSDMAPNDWMLIAQDIQANYADFDGFIILHGTDTMAYTASALSFIFENLRKPVIITGSQIPLAEIRSDGQSNLLNALFIAANYPIPEVALFFNNYLFRGNRARKIDANGFNAFESPNFRPLLSAGIKIQSEYKPAELLVDTGELRLCNIASQPVALFTLYPGFDAKLFENLIDMPIKAMVLMTFGVGNAPNNPVMHTALAKAQKRQVMVVNCTQCVKGKVDMRGYANGLWLAGSGVVSGADMTPEAALTKLHYLLSRHDLSFYDRCQLMSENLRGELSE